MKKYISGLKVLSIFAISCTIILWLMLWASSLVPSDASGELTSSVTDTVNDVFDVEGKINSTLSTQSISLTCTNNNSAFFLDDHPQLEPVFYPSGTTDRDVYYEISDSLMQSGDGTVDQNGLVTFYTVGQIGVAVYLKSDPSINSYIFLSCQGENPLDSDYPERLSLTTTSDTLDFKVGDSSSVLLNGGKTSLDCVSFEFSDPEVAFYDHGAFYAKKTGSTKVTATISAKGEEKSIIFDINVKGNDALVIPDIIFKDNIFIKMNDTVDISDIVVTDGLEYCDYLITSSDENVIRCIAPSRLFAVGSGEVTLTFTSAYSEDISKSITLNVDGISPDYLKIVGSDRIIPGSSKYRVNVYPYNSDDDVIWKVVDGNGSIDENGVLTVDFFGYVTIRCQSAIDERIYADKTVKISLYATPYYFVRKLMGHAGLSALLGFGLMGTAILLCRKKRNCLLTIPLAVIYAGFSEFLQKFAEGRSCLFTDFIIDLVGSLIGMAVAIAVFSLILITWRIINKNSFNKLKSVLKVQSFRNVFVKTDKIENKYFIHEPEVLIEEITTDISDNL